jgi:hypothetical protein
MFPRNKLGTGIGLPKSDLTDGLFGLVSFFFKSAINENRSKSGFKHIHQYMPKLNHNKLCNAVENSRELPIPGT